MYFYFDMELVFLRENVTVELVFIYVKFQKSKCRRFICISEGLGYLCANRRVYKRIVLKFLYFTSFATHKNYTTVTRSALFPTRLHMYY